MGKLICLIDQQGKPVYFEPANLMDQVFAAGLIELQGASKAAALNLARKVREVRDLQKRYFQAGQTDGQRKATLEQCKRLEKVLDELVSKFLQTVPNLP